MTDENRFEQYLSLKIDRLAQETAEVIDRLGTNHLTEELSIAKNTVIKALERDRMDLLDKINRLEKGDPDVRALKGEIYKLKSTLGARETEIKLLEQKIDFLQSELSSVKESHRQDLEALFERQEEGREFSPAVMIVDRLNRTFMDDDKSDLHQLEVSFWVFLKPEKAARIASIKDYTSAWPKTIAQVGPLHIACSGGSLGGSILQDGTIKALLVVDLIEGWNKVTVHFDSGDFRLSANDTKPTGVSIGSDTLECKNSISIGAGEIGAPWSGELMDFKVRFQPSSHSSRSDWRYLTGASRKWNV